MPTYDYECDSCAHAFELFQSISEPVKRKCPRCGRKSLRRLFGTGAAILFKGSGFYQTDYRSESYKRGVEAEKKASDSKAGKASESKTLDSKPADGKVSSGGSTETGVRRPKKAADAVA
ncbi:MAG TPA: zinc ribbon domain-containing protein [Candidatus Anammoximicrobium sp.]|nr:zinc ribbon domain-containing protein [Candidatus Anammoximicrobium sp.]